MNLLRMGIFPSISTFIFTLKPILTHTSQAHAPNIEGINRIQMYFFGQDGLRYDIILIFKYNINEILLPSVVTLGKINPSIDFRPKYQIMRKSFLRNDFLMIFYFLTEEAMFS